MKWNQKIKYFVFGVVTAIIFGALAMPVMASMIQKQILVSTGVKIYVDDVKLNPVDSSGRPIDVFIYNGTTYLPVRAVADAVGKPVYWDGKTSSVYLGKHDSDQPSAMLKDLKYFDRSGNNFKTIKDIKDNLGNEYVDGIYANISYGTEWQTYLINNMYSKMKGRFILNEKYRDTKSEIRFKVYGDGKLLYSSPIMTGGVKPIDFEIDLTGVLELKIEYIGDFYRAALVDTGLYQ